MKSARINFGIPDSEYIVQVDDTGAATSCYNQDTETEYVGGGGGGDFSTAKLTIVNPEENDSFSVDNYFVFPFIDDNAVQCYYFDSVEPLQSIEIDIVLYKGTAIGVCFTVADFTFSGNISEDDGVLTITGDCTITYTPEP